MIAPLFPNRKSRRGKRGRPVTDIRAVCNGALWVLYIGRLGTISRSSGIWYALRSIADDSQPGSLHGANSPSSPKIRRPPSDSRHACRRAVQRPVA
jgi:hypothetical protein